MTTYVALLRGINVGGHRKLPMAQLRELFKALDCDNVRTYLQSGNVVFDAKGTLKSVQTRVTRGVAEHFYDDVPVLVRTAEQLQTVIDSNPYAALSAKDPKAVHAVFLSNKPKPAQVKALEPYINEGEHVVVTGDVLYLACLDGYGKTKLTPALIERILRVTTTARNWQTVRALQAMMAEASDRRARPK